MAHTDPDAALVALRDADFDVVVTDLNMRGMNGLELCERIVANRPDVPVIVITAFGSLETAVGAIRAGAYDFITKPVELDALVVALERAVAAPPAARRGAAAAPGRRRSRAGFGDLHRHEPGDARGLRPARRASPTPTRPCSITGESGTGKELVARALHEREPRARTGRSSPSTARRCPEALLESELFGHARGAFTDARGARARACSCRPTAARCSSTRSASMPLGTAAEAAARAAGATRAAGRRRRRRCRSTSRIVAATNRDLEAEVEERRFREDLYYRINVVHVELPPLRARGGDVLLAGAALRRPVLAARAGKRVTGIVAGAAAEAARLPLARQRARAAELHRARGRAHAFDQIAVDDLPETVRDYRRSHVVVASDDPSELVPLDEVERRYILRVLRGGRRQQDAGRPGPRPRPQDAVPQARRVRLRGGCAERLKPRGLAHRGENRYVSTCGYLLPVYPIDPKLLTY